MANNSWQTLKMVARGDGPSLSGSAAPTSIWPVADRVIIPANSLFIGKAFRLTAFGRLSNIVTTPGTLTLDLKFGSVIVYSTGAMQLSTTAHTTLPWMLEAMLVCRSIGNSTNATMFGQGRANSQCLSLTAVADSTTTPAALLAPNTTPAVGTGFDSTADNSVDLYATFSVSNAGNLILAHGIFLEDLN